MKLRLKFVVSDENYISNAFLNSGNQKGCIANMHYNKFFSSFYVELYKLIIS